MAVNNERLFGVNLINHQTSARDFSDLVRIQSFDGDDELRQKRAFERLDAIAAKVHKLVDSPLIALSNDGITDFELIKIVLPILEDTAAKAKWSAIDLSFNQLTPLCINQFVRTMNVLSRRVHIRGIHLDGVDLGDSGANDLWNGFSSELLTSLEVLTLRFTKFTVVGALNASKVLPRSNLKVLILDGNPLGNDGATSIVNSLRDSKLEILSLGITHVTDSGVIAFGASLSRLKMFRELSLSFNEITDVGAMFLSKELAKNRSMLQKLDLSGNAINDLGVRSFVSAVKATDLEYLDFRGNNFSLESAHELLSLIKLKKSKWSRTVQALLSARDVPRLGKSSPMSALPKELVREVAKFLPQNECIPIPKHQVLVLNWIVNISSEPNHMQNNNENGTRAA